MTSSYLTGTTIKIPDTFDTKPVEATLAEYIELDPWSSAKGVVLARRVCACLIASFAWLSTLGCSPQQDFSEPKTPLDSGSWRVTSAAVPGRHVPAPVVSTRSSTSLPGPTASANPLARHYVSNYVQIDGASLERLTGAKRAELFESLPVEAFIYANADLDDKSATEVRGSYLDDRFPHKDEPLLLLYLSKKEGRPVVTTADGAEVAVEWQQLSERQGSNPVFASTPRLVRIVPEAAALKTSALQYPDTGSGWVLRALGPLATAVSAEFSTEEYWKTTERIQGLVRAAADTTDGCRDRASAKFDDQVRAGTWTADAPSGRTITVKSPRALQAEQKAVEHSDKVCGNRAALQKKYAAIYDAEDNKIRERLTSERARLYARSTARFRSSQ
jgi:hypothetical protein